MMAEESKPPSAVNQTEVVVLVHGFFRDGKDMHYLLEGLAGRGWTVMNSDLPTTFGSLEECSRSLWLQINSLCERYNKISFVAHSMGGLIVCDCLKNLQKDKIGRCVFIATPFKGSKLANILVCFPGVRAVFKPLVDLRSTGSNSVSMDSKSSSIGLIAGEYRNDSLGGCVLPSRNDGRVEVESAFGIDATDHLILNYGHHDIHKRKETLQAVDSFLHFGKFRVDTIDTALFIRGSSLHNGFNCM